MPLPQPPVPPPSRPVLRRWGLREDGACSIRPLDVDSFGAARDEAIELIAHTGRPVVIMARLTPASRWASKLVIGVDILRLPRIAATMWGGRP